MLKEQINNQNQVIHEFSISENFTVQRILTFLKNSLSEFEKELNTSKLQIHLEDDISGQLALFFQSKAKNKNLLFDFNPRIGVDFSIHISPMRLGAKPIFIVEAKRLSKSHRDYVKGKTGGIERFKREQNGFGQHLVQSSMIGYIQEETPQYWEAKVNRWIEDLIGIKSELHWEKEDKLVLNGNVSDFISKHRRISGSSIILYHFWIALS